MVKTAVAGRDKIVYPKKNHGSTHVRSRNSSHSLDPTSRAHRQPASTKTHKTVSEEDPVDGQAEPRHSAAATSPYSDIEIKILESIMPKVRSLWIVDTDKSWTVITEEAIIEGIRKARLAQELKDKKEFLFWLQRTKHVFSGEHGLITKTLIDRLDREIKRYEEDIRRLEAQR